MLGSITVLYYVNDYRYNVVKSFQIIEALGIMNSQSLNSPQRILLKGFHNHDSPEEFNLPKFEERNVVLATVRNPPVIKYNDAIIVVTFTDYVDQEPFTIRIDCHYLASVPHLIQITPTITKNSVLFISEEFILHNNNNYVHIKSMSSSDQQKSLLNSVNISWKTKTTNEATGSRSIAKKIGAKINANGKNEDSLSANKMPSGIVEPSPANSKA
ncbi:2717_t:CDS:2, partial [Gigaspora rosea]